MIQSFADTYGTEVTVVGSRAAGTANALSDFDYVISGTSKIQKAARACLPRGIGGGEIGPGGPTGIDIFAPPVNPNLPNITFTPKP